MEIKTIQPLLEDKVKWDNQSASAGVTTDPSELEVATFEQVRTDGGNCFSALNTQPTRGTQTQ